MRVNNLVIETTRRCPLECSHCLRGDTQQIDMVAHYLNDFLKPVTEIGMITFTGGEPFLNPDCIEHFINTCKRNNIYVGDFYIATNGLIFNEYSALAEKGLMQIARLYALCCDNDVSSIDISRTQFHEGKIDNSNLLYAFKFVGEREPMSDNSIIAEGRALEYGLGTRSLNTEDLINWDYPEDVTFYLNCKGEVCFDCDFSYETQDEVSISIEEAHTIMKQLEEAEEQNSLEAYG